MKTEEIAVYDANLRIFIENALNTESDPNIQKIYIRFFDHSDLALRQYTMITSEDLYIQMKQLDESFNIIKNDTEARIKEIGDKYDAEIKSSRKKIKKTEKEVYESIKNTLRDYISIFGVFSAIIITFVGGLSFTSGVLESMASVNKYRLIFVICLLSFTVFNVIYYLIEVILKISKITIKKEVYCCITKRKLNIPTLFNMTIVIILLLDAVFWFISKC